MKKIYCNHNGQDVKHSISTKSKLNMKLNMHIYIKNNKNNVLAIFYTFIIKLYQMLVFSLLKEVFKPKFPESKRKLLKELKVILTKHS